MRRKTMGLFLVLVLAIGSFLGCSNSAAYELPYYDQNDDAQGYSEELFYSNEQTVTGLGDPTVVEVTDPEDPYYGWYYLYGTGGIGNGYVSYRSRDLHSWEYVDVAFVAEDGAAPTYRLWAPDVIYDKDTDKYYMFFSPYNIYYPGAGKENPDMPWRNAKPFVNREQKDKYWYYVDWIHTEFAFHSGTDEADREINRQTIERMRAIMTERMSLLINEDGSYNDGVVVDDLYENGTKDYKTAYTKAMIDVAKDAYERYIDLEMNAQSELIAYLQFAMVDMWTMDIYDINHAGSGQGISIAISDKPQGPFIQYTNEEGKVNKGTGEAYNPDKRTITLKDWFIAPEDLYPWITYHRPDWYEGVEGDIGVIPEHYEVRDDGAVVYIPEQTVKGQQLTFAVGNKSKDPHSYHNPEVQLSLNDVSAFVDPVTGDKYLYICKHNNAPDRGWILAVKIGDKNASWTDDPMWETTTRLTRQSYYTCDEISSDNYSQITLQEGVWVNEGPFTYYNPESKLYYLTMSSSSYNTRDYTAHTAISTSPLGPFRKLKPEEGGVLLRAADNWDHIAGPGHHTFIETQGELWIVYQKHKNPLDNYESGRGIVADPVKWVYNSNGVLVPHVNGPSNSPQPVVGLDKKYDNIAAQAKVTATNVAEGSNTHYLVDDVIRYYSWDDFINDFESGNEKKTTITLSFDDYRTIRAIMVYNTWDYGFYFDEVERVELDFKKQKDGAEVTGTAYIENLAFDVEAYVNTEVEKEEFLRPGAAAIAEFEELAVKEIRITFNSKKPIKVAEIKVLGK